MQTLRPISLCSITKETLKETLDNATKLLLIKDFKLGKGYCRNSQENASLLQEIISTNICSLVNNIKASVDGEEVEYTSVFTLNKDIEELYQNKSKYENEILYNLWLERGNTGSMGDFLDEITKDDSVEWSEMSW